MLWNSSRWLKGLGLAMVVVACAPPMVGQDFTINWGTITRHYSVEATAEGVPGGGLLLKWRADPKAASYKIWKKWANEGQWTFMTELSGPATQWRDDEAGVGDSFEYRFEKEAEGYRGYGQIFAGNRARLVDDRGAVLFLVDSTWVKELAHELFRMESDLIGDGWTVIRRDLSPLLAPPEVKKVIVDQYAKMEGRLEAVYLFGHLPVPYSGDITPDDHPTTHQGAWPADVYYGDVNGHWTDQSVNNRSAERAANWNVPGDGKFDQSTPPTEVELQVGRVDLWNMTAFGNKEEPLFEVDLLRRYLNKNHAYRHAHFRPPRRAALTDHVGDKGEDPVAGSAWRAFSGFYGPDNIDIVWYPDVFNNLRDNGYSWHYISGGGSFYSSTPNGTTDSFVTNKIHSVFGMYIGSYFGDWNNESNFMRASLGAEPWTLTASWSGFPQWMYHHMALGYPIGHGARVTQNNRGDLYPPATQGTGQIHISLLGDPSLRLHMVAPPRALQGSIEGGGFRLEWAPSDDAGLLGYHIYASQNWSGPYQRLTQEPVSATGFFHSTSAPAGHYMARAIKLETTATGTYTNASQGILLDLKPAPPTAVTAETLSVDAIRLSWADFSSNTEGFLLERRIPGESFQRVASLSADVREYVDRELTSGKTFEYRLSSFNGHGESVCEQTVQAATTLLRWVGVDDQTQGDWIGQYGASGYIVTASGALASPTHQLTIGEAAQHIWTDNTSERRALIRWGGRGRQAACYYDVQTVTLRLEAANSDLARLALYFVDWDRQGRRQLVEVLDQAGRTLDSHTLSDFGEGKFLVWDVRGAIQVRITRLAGPNVILTGAFLDVGNVPNPPLIEPPGATFEESVAVRISAEQNTQVFYTLDGSTPTTESLRYSEPFNIDHSVQVSAKAFPSEGPASSVARAGFWIQSEARFLGFDTETKGAWIGRYGSEGYRIAGGEEAWPGNGTVDVETEWLRVWDEYADLPSALQGANGSKSLAAVWYAKESFSIYLDPGDNRRRRLAIYCWAAEGIQRKETLELFSPATGERLSRIVLSPLTNSVYSLWNIRGPLQLRITHLTGSSGIVNAVFLDPPATAPEEPWALRIGTTDSGAKAVPSVSGGYWGVVVLEGSEDLVHWEVIEERSADGKSLEFQPADISPSGVHFFRARLKVP